MGANMIHVITGPPCAGKTTYMRRHAAEGDVLVDYDAIAQALGCREAHQARRRVNDINLAAFVARRAVIEWAVGHAGDVEAWIIHTNPMPEDMYAYEKAGADIVEIDVDMETCLERARSDGRPPGTAEAIREWFANRDGAPKGALFMPTEGGSMETKSKTITAKADEAGRITGYASTWTREPDAAGDVVAKGAFAECIERIKEEGKVLPLLWNHDGGDLDAYIGTVDSLEEDDHGLLFSASFDATDKAQRARQLASDGRLCKFSFAYDVLDQMEVELDDGRKANELRKLNIHEVSLVLYPANPDTGIVDVKEADDSAFMKKGIAVLRVVPDMKAIEDAVSSYIESKSGRRNSKADEDALRGVLGVCAGIVEELSSIQSTISGLLGEERPVDEQEPEAEAGAAEANAEEPDAANAEEPEPKAAKVDELLMKARELLEGDSQ